MKKHASDGARDRARALGRDTTDAERKFWRILRLKQIDNVRFRRQAPIGRYIADFVSHGSRLIIEVDGGQHDVSSEAEITRTRFLESERYRELRFWNNEALANPDGVFTVIVGALARDHPHLSFPIKGKEHEI
jgi:very-short-patch-repair endonuclease